MVGLPVLRDFSSAGGETVSMAEDILEGIFCEECGEFIGEPVGYPRKCSGCKPKHRKQKSKKKGKSEQPREGK